MKCINKDGECVESKPVLLGNSELVQFSFNDAQLTTFQPMVSGSSTSALSWLIAIYALGLINKKQMEKEAAVNGKNTIPSEYAKYNIQYTRNVW